MNKQLEQMVSEDAVLADCLQVCPQTFMRLSYDPPKRGKRLYGFGYACCMASDVWDAELGQTIARGRAVKQIVQQIEARGDHRVVVNRGGTINITNCNFRQDAMSKPAIEILRELST